MPYKICIVDDQLPFIPGRDTTVCSHNEMLEMLTRTWDEQPTQRLVRTLIEDPDNNWVVSATKNPEFYLSAAKDLFRADIIIFDWDYGTQARESQEYLYDILRTSFSIVCIYTHLGQDEQISAILAENRFDPFRNRLHFVRKSDADSHTTLLETARQLFDDNYAFRFEAQLRSVCLSGLDEVLVEFGKVTLAQTRAWLEDTSTDSAEWKEMLIEKLTEKLDDNNELIQLLADSGFHRREVKSFVEMVCGKIRSFLEVSPPHPAAATPAAQQAVTAADYAIMRSLWNFRLYNHPANNMLVRRGDIIKESAANSDVLYLVLTPDCELYRFWHKCYGILNVIPLYRASRTNTLLNTKLTLTREAAAVGRAFERIASFMHHDSGLPPNVMVLPSIRIGTQLQDYIVFANQLECREIPMPQNVRAMAISDKAKEALQLCHLTAYERVCAVSEPFISPLAQLISASIIGFGTPDYPRAFQGQLKTSLQGDL